MRCGRPLLTDSLLASTIIVVIVITTTTTTCLHPRKDPIHRMVSAYNMKWQERVCGEDAWKMPDCFKQLISVNVTLDSLQRDWQNGLRSLVDRELDVMGQCHALARDSVIHSEEEQISLTDGGGGSATMARQRQQSSDSDPLVSSYSDPLAPQQPISPLQGESDDLSREYDQVLMDCLGFPTMNSVDLWHRLEDHSNVYRSIYYDQLARWMRSYPHSSFLIWSSEDFEHSPHQHMEDMVLWLGLDPHDTEPSVMTGRHHQRRYVTMIPVDVKERLVEFFRPHNERLFQFLEERGFDDAVDQLKRHFHS